jgi:NAD(P)-dependent dehydrogenase (short-subunit alcohol dehydrogenase family)
LINSAGGSSAPGGGVLALTDADWQQEFELNLFSAVRLDRGFLPARA